MNSVAFSVWKFDVRWYSIFILIGMLMSIFVIFKEVKRQKYNKCFFTNLVFYVILFGIVGARLYYVLFNLDYYLSNPIEIIKVWNGGLAIHGGILVGILVTVIYTKKYKTNTLKAIDVSVVGVIIGQAIGRWGNFFNQEAYGPVVDKAKLAALKLPKFIIDGMYIDGIYHQPAFLYESIWNFFGFIFLLIIRKYKYLKIGVLTGIYLIWYSMGRLFIEGLRADSLMIGNFRVAQLISIMLILVGILIIVRSMRKPKLENLYNVEAEEIRF